MMIDAVHDRWATAAARPAAQAGALRREPRLDGRARARSAGCPTSRGWASPSVLWVGPPNASPLWSAHHRTPRPRHPGGRAALRQRAHRAVLAGHRRRGDRRRHRAAVGGHPGAVPAASRRTRSSGGRRICCSTGRTGSKEPPGRDRTASMRWYPIITFWQVAADMTNAVVGARRARPQLRRLRARRLGRRGPARRVDARGHRTHPRRAGEDRGRRRARILMRPSKSRAARGWRRRWSAGGLVGTAAPAAWHPMPHASLGAGAGRDHPRTARTAPARAVVGAAARRCAPARWSRSASPRRRRSPPVRDGDGRARPARVARDAGWCCASRSARCGRRRPRTAPRWAPSRREAFGPPAAGCCRPRRSGCRTSPTPAATGEPVRRHRAGHRCGGLGVRLAARAVGQPGRADAGAPGDQRGGRGRGDQPCSTTARN